MLVKLMLRFTTNVTSSPTTSRRSESASAATASNAGPSAVANARYSASVQLPGSRSAERNAASTSVSRRSGALGGQVVHLRANRLPVTESAVQIAASLGQSPFGVDRGVQIDPAGRRDL